MFFSIFDLVVSKESVANGALASAKTRREKNTQQRSDSAHTYTHPTQLTLLEHRLQPTPPLTGQDGPAAHCSMYPGE